MVVFGKKCLDLGIRLSSGRRLLWVYFGRYVAVSGSEIVTMVSLISPAASDTEEVEVEVKPKPKSSPIKPSLGKKEEKDVVGGKNVSLRKTVKSGE